MERGIASFAFPEALQGLRRTASGPDVDISDRETYATRRGSVATSAAARRESKSILSASIEPLGKTYTERRPTLSRIGTFSPIYTLF